MPDQWTDRLSAYLDDELQHGEREALDDHLDSCHRCRAALEEMRQVTEWAVTFPGRKPAEDGWHAIEKEIAAASGGGSRRERRTSFWGSMAAGLAALTPAWGGFARIAAITGLVAVSLFGMGRSFYLERVTASLERKATQLDMDLGDVATGMIWHRSAEDLRGRIGQRFEFTCPAYGEPDAIWGTGEYTDDSSICNAAVHEGLITYNSGGTVTIEITAGKDGYAGSARNGVESRDSEHWSGGFIVVAAEPGPEPRVETNVGVDTDVRVRTDFRFGVAVKGEVDADPDVSVEPAFTAAGGTYAPIGYDDTATRFRGWIGTRIGLMCPGGSRLRAVWGSDPYTDDSSICSAAVHAGLITLAEGGRVVVEIERGSSGYSGSFANGVETRDWDSDWSGSFSFPDARRRE